MKEAVIVAGARTAVGKAPKGTLRETRPDELAAAAIRETLRRAPQVKPEQIDDVILGCAMPEREQGMNLARIVSLRAGIPESVPAVTVNRFCSSGLQTIAQASERIQCGAADIILAGGVESMSFVSFTAATSLSPNPHLAAESPNTYLAMGLTAEQLSEEYKISREDADQFSFDSHRKASAAIANGNFKDEIFPFTVEKKTQSASGEWTTNQIVFDTDEGPRSDTSLEKLATLKPVFKQGGVVTAGNSSQTSDGAAMVMVMSADKAKELGLEVMATFRGFDVAGVRPEIMGIGPVEAIPKLLKRRNMTLDQIDLIELNEAFACQSLAVMRELNLSADKVNVNGGAVALGHPLGCSGAKLTLTLIHELKRRGGGQGIVSMCIGGGMGAAGLFEV